MTARIIFLNAWLDCPLVILRRNYSMQDKITEARNYVFYKMREERRTASESSYLYQVWIQKNRARIKLVVEESLSDTFDDEDIPPAY